MDVLGIDFGKTLMNCSQKFMGKRWQSLMGFVGEYRRGKGV